MLISDCYDVEPILSHNITTNESHYVYDIEQFLAAKNSTIHFDRSERNIVFHLLLCFSSFSKEFKKWNCVWYFRVKSVDLFFTLTTIHLKELSKIYTPDCFMFNISVSTWYIQLTVLCLILVWVPDIYNSLFYV